MFSEYASRFLAQSQSRFSSRDEERGGRFGGGPGSIRGLRAPQRGYQGGRQRQPLGQFPFAARGGASQAPLFQSATEDDDLGPHRHDNIEDEEQAEHEREVADFYALQRSRRQFGAGRVDESVQSRSDDNDDDDDNASQRSTGKDRMVDVGLASEIRDGPEEENSENDDDPPPFQQFRKLPPQPEERYLTPQPQNEYPRRPPSAASSVAPPAVSAAPPEPPRYDVFFAHLFLISLASLFASFVLVFLHTSLPGSTSKKSNSLLGDTVYTTLHSSFHLLAVDTLVAVIVSLLWLSLLRNFVRPLVYLLLVAVPAILFSFSIYPLVSSFRGIYHGNSAQDQAMRWLSFIPGITAILWTYTVFRARHSLQKAIGILEFTVRILAENPALLLLGLGTLVGVIAWTWIWMGMFTRIFLGGHQSVSRHLFIIDTGSWWLGAWFMFTYLWTLSVGSGVQRATTAATVSQWYFHRRASPAPTSRQVVSASLSHAVTTMFGTICLSTLLSLLVRLPLLVLPRRMLGCIALCTYSFMPTSITALTNPLSLTYASIHSQPLSHSARGLGQMSFLSPSTPTTTLQPNSFSNAQRTNTSPLLPYRLVKLLLYATRFMMSLALGFGGWVSTARMLVVEGSHARGSLYAYIVGIIAAAIGWGVLGSVEGILGGILDAAVICWGSENRSGGAGRSGGYCLEANWLFGEEAEV